MAAAPRTILDADLESDPGSDQEWSTRTAPYRAELLAHCYRMLGSFHDAEELLQDAMVRAWRARDRYDPDRASLRTWLYRIATNVCLTALSGRARRPLPSGLGPTHDDPRGPLRPGFEVPWLQPFPDAAIAGDAGDAVLATGSLRLALVAAMQLLPPRQRAVLILRDVLRLPAAEAASILEITPAAVNSALQRARATLAGSPLAEEDVRPSDRRRDVELIDRYVDAFRRCDVAALTRLVSSDVVMEMPPFYNWFAGRGDYGRFMARAFDMRGTDWRTVRTEANGQQAVCAYVRPPGEAVHRVHTLQVFTIRGGRVVHNTVFQDPLVFATFGLPPTLEPQA
ncbi:MAG: rpoE [Ilumatobacteraceae bacterium]|nr:rpoE [Ilumatobacteraceae bacterium]